MIPGSSEQPAGPQPARGEPAPQPAAYSITEPAPRRLQWPVRTIWVVLFAILSFEIGLFLAVFPWMDYWSFNHLAGYVPTLEYYWDDPYFKGAITGLGCVDLYIAAAQIVSLIRGRKPA